MSRAASAAAQLQLKMWQRCLRAASQEAHSIGLVRHAVCIGDNRINRQVDAPKYRTPTGSKKHSMWRTASCLEMQWLQQALLRLARHPGGKC